jgi:multimeric flavodoxin WrbA
MVTGNIASSLVGITVRALVIHGSPRKNGNSDTLTERFLEGLQQTGPHEITHFHLNEMEISPCQGCLVCSAAPEHKCRIDDDMQQVYSAYTKSNLIVWATPMYWGYLTAQMKLAQDRMEALAWEGFGYKTFAVLMTYRHHYESAANMFRRIAPHFNIDLHILECCTYDKETGKDVPIEDIPEKQREAYDLGERLGLTSSSS